MITLTINGKQIQAQKGMTILEAALKAGIYIPNLCYHPDLTPSGTCRLCIVQVKDAKGFPTACNKLVEEGMLVTTDSEQIQELRRNLMWLILSEFKGKPGPSSTLYKVMEYIGIKTNYKEFGPKISKDALIMDSPLYKRDSGKCILCGRCVKICNNVRGIGVIGFVNRGIESLVSTTYNAPLIDTECRLCGACAEVCPSGAIIDKDEYDETTHEKVLVPCKYACPAGIDIPSYVKAIAENNFQDAIEIIREKAPFPQVLCHVCPHPCEAVCRRGKVNNPISIKELKRFVAERDTGRWKNKINVLPDSGKKVAIVGSGPAGLTCAWFLRLQGHSVTVFEEMPKAGGMLRLTIPRYRLPESVLDKEIKNLTDFGVKIVTNRRTNSLEELYGEGFNHVFLAIGATEVMKMDIPGENLEGVLDGISVLEAINYKKKADFGKVIAIVGGGNVAIDVARTVLRLGAEKVSILYRRTRDEMPASPEEIDFAIEEGVSIEYLTAPVRIFNEHGKLFVECIRMTLGKPDESGRRRPVPVKDSHFNIQVDAIVKAIGQRPSLPAEMNIEKDKSGRIIVNKETLVSSLPNIYAGGDAVTGPATVIEAIQAGRIAASAIDKALGGSGTIFQEFVSRERYNDKLEKRKNFAHETRAHVECVPIVDRICSFDLVEKCYDEATAVKEADRCLRCEMRLTISKSVVPE